MGSGEERQGWSTAAFLCPACKQPVQAVVTRRRKVFGAYVPVWEPGPCENPECSESHGVRSRAVSDEQQRDEPQPH